MRSQQKTLQNHVKEVCISISNLKAVPNFCEGMQKLVSRIKNHFPPCPFPDLQLKYQKLIWSLNWAESEWESGGDNHTAEPCLMACLLTQIQLYAAGDLEKSNQAFLFEVLEITKLCQVWHRHALDKVKLPPLSPSELLNISSYFVLPQPFYLHLSDRQHSGFWHSQMIWSFNLLKGLQQAVFHVNHTELLLHQDFSRLKSKTAPPTTKDILYSTDVASCAIVVQAPQPFLEPFCALSYLITHN